MRKFLICLLIFFVSNCCIAEEINVETLRENAIGFYNSNDLENAFKNLEKIPDAEKTAEDYLLMANLKQDYDNYYAAIDFLQLSLKKDNNFYKAYYNLGIIYIQQKKYLLAIESFQKAIKINKDFAWGYYNLGCCYLELKNYKVAKSYFNRAILRKNDVPDFYYNLALAYKKLNDTKNAEKVLKIYNELSARG